MRLNIGAQDSLEVFLGRNLIDKIFLAVIKLARREYKINDEVRRLTPRLNRLHLNPTSIDYRVHSHSQQIYHHLDEVVFLHCNERRNIP